MSVCTFHSNALCRLRAKFRHPGVEDHLARSSGGLISPHFTARVMKCLVSLRSGALVSPSCDGKVPRGHPHRTEFGDRCGRTERLPGEPVSFHTTFNHYQSRVESIRRRTRFREEHVLAHVFALIRWTFGRNAWENSIIEWQAISVTSAGSIAQGFSGTTFPMLHFDWAIHRPGACRQSGVALDLHQD